MVRGDKRGRWAATDPAHPRTVPYLETWTLIEKAHEILGMNFSIEVRDKPQHTYTSLNPQTQRVTLTVSCVVRVVLSNGTFRDGLGTGSASNMPLVEGIKMAEKSSVSDAIKRALALFGPALGGSLRDKAHVDQLLLDIKHAKKPRSTPATDAATPHPGVSSADLDAFRAAAEFF